MEMMKEAENARDEALDNARKAIEEASMEIVNLVQKVISDAANESRTGSRNRTTFCTKR